MIKRIIQGFRRAKRLKDERGNALVEMAICLPVFLILVFALIDFSQRILDQQMMSAISRQGSDLASRTKIVNGTTADPLGLQTIVSALVTQGNALNIGTNGRIILTAVSDNTSGSPQIVDQQESTTGISVTSSIGSGNGNPATMPSAASTALSTGHTLFVTEVFYSYSPMTPIGKFMKTSPAGTLYEAAYF
jgi:Flp pilus assembly protein TadG